MTSLTGICLIVHRIIDVQVQPSAVTNISSQHFTTVKPLHFRDIPRKHTEELNSLTHRVHCKLSPNICMCMWETKYNILLTCLPIIMITTVNTL